MNLGASALWRHTPHVDWHEIYVAGELLTLHLSGAVWWEAERTLIVSDLHLEKASSYATRGVMLPPYDTAVTLDRLAAVIDHFEPARVISLGDSFHDGEAAARMSMVNKTRLAMMQLGREWIWISGNHDPEASAGLFGEHTDEADFGALVFRHEPLADMVLGEIAGHLHPAGRIRRHGRSIRRPCFAGDHTRLVMPAFGALTGGLNVLEEPWDPLFDDLGFTAYMLGEDRIYPIPAHKLRED
ncbi:putative phosphoesterase [Breoghania corrubedonensis]|uniref:Putative phosphoesterase n=1 Tax=Breoghania corrubedonensis TaxID=665038 RepID=A0A2T5VEB9_9HYPH|nr:ligase-associated DNA damage response endonuclease PdeM [Breoghania corrubedonensis]PTW62105.1 putative phosphoesterase [Breoghania corrubedonensis]